MEPAYDCRTCGACCAPYAESDCYVRLSDGDLERLQGLSLSIIDQIEGEDMIPTLGTKRDAEGKRVCVAFEGEVGKPCGCGIYERRPFACRVFEAGSVLCREARQTRGLPV
jgi:Fe-S-cluster containining protein